MKLIHHGLEITDLPDDWLAEAGMVNFVPNGAAYPADFSECHGQQMFEVRLEDVAPVLRTAGVAIFKDDPETGRTARQRVVSILRGFRAGAKLPPVSVVPLRTGEVHKYKLVAGVHRFYCSLAAGFTSIPVVKGLDWDSLDA